jgi:hypothetical protein
MGMHGLNIFLAHYAAGRAYALPAQFIIYIGIVLNHSNTDEITKILA